MVRSCPGTSLVLFLAAASLLAACTPSDAGPGVDAVSLDSREPGRDGGALPDLDASRADVADTRTIDAALDDGTGARDAAGDTSPDADLVSRPDGGVAGRVPCDETSECWEIFGHPSDCEWVACWDDVCRYELREDGYSCDDASLCTTDDSCSHGVCGGRPVTCDDDEACTADSCEPDTGCVFTPVAGVCGDGAGQCLYGFCCVPDCTGRDCGGDGCGDSCGSCGVGEMCDASHRCVPDSGGGPGTAVERLWRATLRDQVIGATSYEGWLAATVRGGWGLFVWGVSERYGEGASVAQPTLLQRSYYTRPLAMATYLEMTGFDRDRIAYRTESAFCMSDCPSLSFGAFDLRNPAELSGHGGSCWNSDSCWGASGGTGLSLSGDHALLWSRGGTIRGALWLTTEGRWQNAPAGSHGGVTDVFGGDDVFFIAFEGGRLVVLEDPDFQLDPEVLEAGYFALDGGIRYETALYAPATIDAMAGAGDRLLLMGAALGLIVLDASVPLHPRVEAQNLSLRWPNDFEHAWAPQVEIVGSRAYVLYADGGERFIDVLSIASGGPPERLGTIPLPHQDSVNGLYRFAAFGEHLAIPDGDGLLVLGPASPPRRRSAGRTPSHAAPPCRSPRSPGTDSDDNHLIQFERDSGRGPQLRRAATPARAAGVRSPGRVRKGVL